MSNSRFRRSSIEMGKDGAGKDILAHGITSGAYLKWDAATDTLYLVNADFDIVGDVEIEGDLSLTTEDISLVQGRRVYLSGQDGDEYISSEAAGYLDLEALTAIRPGADLLTDRWQNSITNVFLGMGVCGAGGLAAAGLHNVAIGGDAMWSIATSKQSVAVGYKAMYNQTAGHYNVAVGYMALYEAEGSRNVAVGYQALKTMDAGTGANWNVGVGSSALEAVTTGTCNVGLGGRAGYLVTTGANNIVIGYTAGDNITTADTCIIIGHAVDAPSATVDAQIKIGGGSATQGYILGDSAGDMMVNAVTGKTVELGVNATAVGTFAGALITLAQITSITNALEASAVGTASLKTAGGLGVAGKAYIGTELLLVAGPLDMSTVAEDIEIKANTIAALEIKGAANLLVFDTRNAITGVTGFAFILPDIGFASASGSTRVGVSIDPGTLTFSDTQTVTAMEGLGLYISAHTFAGTAATVSTASTVYIASAPASGGNVTVTNGYALKVATGDCLFGGPVWISGAVTGVTATPLTITAAAPYRLSVHTTVDTASTGWMNPIAFDFESTASAAMSGDVQMVGIQAYARLTTGSAWTSSGGFCGFSSVLQTAGTTTATSGVMSAITAVMQIAAGHTSSLQSKVAGLVIQNQVNGSASMGDHFSGILIMGGTYETLTSGIKIEDGATITAINIDACITGIDIGDCTTGINLSGTCAGIGIDFADCALTVTGRDTAYISMGNYSNHITLDLSGVGGSDRFYGIQMYLDSTTNTSGGTWFYAIRPEILVNTNNQTNTNFSGLVPTFVIEKNIASVRCVMAQLEIGHLNVTAISAGCSAVSGYVNLGTETKNLNASGTCCIAAIIGDIENGKSVTLTGATTRVFAVAGNIYTNARATGVLLARVDGSGILTSALVTLENSVGATVPFAFNFHAGDWGHWLTASHTHNTAAEEITVQVMGNTRYIRTWKT